ncbi:MAG TPA: CHRD domain-containing protein [Candidatus Sulfotelmatobacter sp.]|nr:CHRD domain-containing protein [Candidatus Sulfotelmatobacter sp.]
MEETSEQKSAYGKRPMWQWVVLYLVIAAVLYGAFYYLFLAKKGGYTNNPSTSYSTPTVQVTETPQAMANEMTVKLDSENNSGESGTAVLKEENGKTTVTVSLTGFTKGVSQPAHIHVGACPGVGAVKYPLTSVLDGKSVTVLNVTLADLKKALPLALNVHKSDKEITVYTACGALSSK